MGHLEGICVKKQMSLSRGGRPLFYTYRLLNSMQLFSYVVVFLLSSLPQRIHAALRSYNLTLHPGTRAPDGVSREVYLINDQQPGPLIEAVEGDDLDIFVQNNLPVEQTIHWHGRSFPQDGVLCASLSCH